MIYFTCDLFSLSWSVELLGVCALLYIELIVFIHLGNFFPGGTGFFDFMCH